MTQIEESEAKEKYNGVAVKYADELHEARMSIRQQTKHEDRTLEARFPPHHRSGLGVALEYERMGNVPVSDELQTRADDFAIEFEHLGITLGTVIHNIDLKQTPSQELIQFIRETLLERKVVFFRDQNLRIIRCI